MPSRQITGRAYYEDDHEVEYLRVDAVESKLPAEYRDDCEPFVEAIRDRLEITAERVFGRTWFTLHTHGLIHLDVACCNHLPTSLRGTSRVDNGLESVNARWLASLASVRAVALRDEACPVLVASYSIQLIN